MTETTSFAYVGPGPGAPLLAQMLRRDGLEVEYEPPIEKRDAGAALEAVRVLFEVVGDAALVRTVVRSLMQRRPGQFRVEGLPDDDDEGKDAER